MSTTIDVPPRYVREAEENPLAFVQADLRYEWAKNAFRRIQLGALFQSDVRRAAKAMRRIEKVLRFYEELASRGVNVKALSVEHSAVVLYDVQVLRRILEKTTATVSG